jgi:hypothetical protein
LSFIFRISEASYNSLNTIKQQLIKNRWKISWNDEERISFPITDVVSPTNWFQKTVRERIAVNKSFGMNKPIWEIQLGFKDKTLELIKITKEGRELWEELQQLN